MTAMLARLANLPEAEIKYMRYGALLHDIGKVAIPDAILLKPGKLSNSEWDIMRKHPGYAYELIYPVEYFRHASLFLMLITSDGTEQVRAG
jgi:HD-GYP domain-containing protein (c-di-GMP phosphodiesterase class II)